MQSALKAFKKLLIISGILVILGYVGNLLIDNPYVHRLLRDAINHELEDYTFLSLKFEAINVRFIPLGVDLYGLELKQKAEGTGAKTLFQTSHVRARVSMIALLLSKPERLNLEINEPKIDLPLPPLETILRMEKFPELQAHDNEPLIWPPKWHLPIYRLAIQNLNLSFLLPSDIAEKPPLLNSRLEGLDLELYFRNANDFDLNLLIRRGNLEVEGSHLLRDTNLNCSLHMAGDELSSSFFRISSSELTAQSSLTAHFDASKMVPKQGLFHHDFPVLKNIDIQLSNNIEQADLAILGRYLGADRTGGLLNGKLDVNLNYALADNQLKWNLKGSAQSDKSTLAGFKLLDSTLDFTITERGMSFDRAVILNGKQELGKASGFLGFDKKVPFEFNIDAKSLPFAQLMSIVQVEDFHAVDMNLDARKINLKGQATPFGMTISGLAEFQNVTLPFVQDLPKHFLTPPSCVIDTKLQISLEALTIESGEGHCLNPSEGPFENVPSPISLSGFFGFSEAKGMSFQLESPALQAHLLSHFTKLPSQGLIKSKVRIKGPYAALVIGGQAEADQFEIGGFAFQDLSTHFELPINENKLAVQSLEARVGQKGRLLVLNSKLGLQAPYPFQGHIEAASLPPEFLPKGLAQTFHIQNFNLTVNMIDANLSGPLLQPFLYQGKATFDLQNLRVDEEHLLSQLQGNWQSSGKQWDLKDTVLRLDDLKVSLQTQIVHQKSPTYSDDLWGKLGLGSHDQLEIHAKTLDTKTSSYRTNDLSEAANHLASLPYIGNFFQAHHFGAEIQFDAHFEGTYKALDGQFQASLEQPFVWDIPISSISLSGFITKGKLNIPELRHSGSALVGRLQIDFAKPDLPYEWYLFFNQMDIRALLGKGFADDPRNFAYLSAEWTMAGTFSHFWASKGEFTLNRVRSKIFQNLGSRTSSVEINSDEPIRVLLSQDRWQFADQRPLKLKGDAFDLELSSGQNQLPNHLDLKLQGTVKLDLLKSFTGVADTARGEIVLDGRLTGSLSNPEFSLRVRERKLDPFNIAQWVPLSLGLSDLGPSFNNISLDVEIRNDRLIVNSFSANKGREGTIQASGTLGFTPETNDISRLSIQLSRIEFSRLLVPVLKTADLVLSGDLTVTGSSRPYQLAGNLQIDRFQSIGNFDLRREIIASLYDSKLLTKSRQDASTEYKPLFTLDVGLNAERSILIKNKSVEATLSSSLRIRGNDVFPLILGQIIADRGSFNYRRQFKLNKAVISFDEPVNPPNPRLEIIGETTVSPYQVQVLVNGDLANPKINLACDPPNREDGSIINSLDIFLLLTTGKIPEQANKTAGRASVNELFSSFLVFAEEPIEKLFDISGQTVVREVYIDSYLSETEQRPITRLNVPFNLWGLANAIVQVDDQSNAKVSFEYPIHEGITFSGSVVDRKSSDQSSKQTNAAADTGFDLKFRFGFD